MSYSCNLSAKPHTFYSFSYVYPWRINKNNPLLDHLGIATAALYMHTPSLQYPPTHILTSVVFTADTGVPSLSAGAHASILAGVGIAQVDLRLAVIAREANWAAAAEASDRMNGTKQDGGRGDEGGRAVEAQH